MSAVKHMEVYGGQQSFKYSSDLTIMVGIGLHERKGRVETVCHFGKTRMRWALLTEKALDITHTHTHTSNTHTHTYTLHIP